MYIRMKEDWNGGTVETKRPSTNGMEWNGMAQIPQVTKQWRREEVRRERERERPSSKERKGKERRRKEEGKKKERRRKGFLL